MGELNIIGAFPFELNQGGAFIKSGEPGFDLIIKGLSELGAETKKTHGGRNTRDAIPLVTAQLELFHNQIEECEKNMEEAVEEQEEIWRRLMLLFVLEKYRGSKLQEAVVKRTDCSEQIWEVFGKSILKATGMTEEVILLKYQGDIIAVGDLHTIWTPAAALEDVEEKGLKGLEDLETYEKDLALTYLQGLMGNGLDCEIYISRLISALKSAGASVKREMQTVPVMGAYAALWKSSGQAGEDNVFSVPMPERHIPYPFHDSLCLTEYEMAGRLNRLSFDVPRNRNEKFTLTALLPLSLELIRVLEGTEDISLENISFIGEEEFLKQQQLGVKLTLKVGKEKIVYRHTYTQKDIYYTKTMPTVSVLPYVNLPEEIWKDYNLILYRGRAEESYADEFQNLKRIDASQIDLIFETRKQESSDKNGYEWYYAKAPALPKTIPLCIVEDEKRRNRNKEAGYIGCIAVEPPSSSELSQEVFEKKLYWAIDLGTSNTVVASREKETEMDYSVIRENVHMVFLKERINASAVVFASNVYAPTGKKTGKFRTMAGIYRYYESGNKNHCYEQGCALFWEFDKLAEEFENASSLSNDHIITEIKFGKKEGLEAAALQIYLENMLWLGCLNAVLRGARQLEVMISYPRKEVLDRIAKVWSEILTVMERKCSLKINLHYMTEAEANYRYQKKNAGNSDAQIAITNDFGIIDIGHGTSDMNFYFHTESEQVEPRQVQVSIRLAGKELLVDTIMEFFQNGAGFEEIWQSSGTDGNKSADKGKEKLEQSRKKLINAYVKNAQERSRRLELREQQENILITLLQEVGLRMDLRAALETKENYRFAAFLKFKYMNLFLIYANILQDCPHSEAVGNFKLFLYGGGRHGVSAAAGASLGKINEKGFGMAVKEAISGAVGIHRDMVDIIAKDTSKKDEVVAGMLYEEPQEKRRLYSKKEEVESFLGYQEEHVGRHVWNSRLKEELETTYKQFISFYNKEQYFIKDEFTLEGEEEGILPIYSYIDISADEKASAQARLMADNNKLVFERRGPAIWDRVSKDVENPPRILYLLFCCKMSESILLSHIRQMGQGESLPEEEGF